MERAEILQEINTIFKDILNDETVVIEEQTTAKDIGEMLNCIKEKGK